MRELRWLSVGIGDGELGEVESIALEQRREHELAAPAVAVVGKHRSDRLELPLVTAERRQGCRDVLHHRLDAELIGERPAEPERVTGGVPLRHEDPDDPLAPEGPNAQGGHHGAVDPARYSDDRSAPTQIAEDDLANAPLDLLGHPAGLDPEHVS